MKPETAPLPPTNLAPAARLEAGLGALQQALLRGDLGALDTLVAEVEAAAQTLTQAPDAPTTQRLRALTARSLASLDQAARGARAARRRLTAIRAAQSGTTVYDDKGTSQKLDRAPGRLEKRA